MCIYSLLYCAGGGEVGGGGGGGGKVPKKKKYNKQKFILSLSNRIIPKLNIMISKIEIFSINLDFIRLIPRRNEKGKLICLS